MSRAMDTVTKELIDSLTDLLKTHPAAALQTFQIGAPVLIDSLNTVRAYAVDRREISALLIEALARWLQRFPQQAEASEALLTIREELGLPEVKGVLS